MTGLVLSTLAGLAAGFLLGGMVMTLRQLRRDAEGLAGENQARRIRTAVEEARELVDRLPWTGDGVCMAGRVDLARTVEGIAWKLDPDRLGLTQQEEVPDAG